MNGTYSSLNDINVYVWTLSLIGFNSLQTEERDEYTSPEYTHDDTVSYYSYIIELY